MLPCLPSGKLLIEAQYAHKEEEDLYQWQHFVYSSFPQYIIYSTSQPLCVDNSWVSNENNTLRVLYNKISDSVFSYLFPRPLQSFRFWSSIISSQLFHVISIHLSFCYPLHTKNHVLINGRGCPATSEY